MSINKYIYPVEINDGVRITYDESPAHMGSLKYSVDFVLGEGAPVYAAYAGVVIDIKSDSDTGGSDKSYEELGNFIEIEHENGEYSEYEHLKKDGVVVNLGDKVERGQLIGYSGNTGWMAQLGPHLHFMVGVYGKSDEEYETVEITWVE
ncbi:MAG: hypothetical protein JWN89_689 [Parcubacteria group bacterium]|nr:hypothetical protein [Parcubacteria group bacterium]